PAHRETIIRLGDDMNVAVGRTDLLLIELAGRLVEHGHPEILDAAIDLVISERAPAMCQTCAAVELADIAGDDRHWRAELAVLRVDDVDRARGVVDIES